MIILLLNVARSLPSTTCSYRAHTCILYVLPYDELDVDILSACNIAEVIKCINICCMLTRTCDRVCFLICNKHSTAGKFALMILFLTMELLATMLCRT